MTLQQTDAARILRAFQAPVVSFDCGQKCAHLNGGVPICCDDSHAIPVLYKNEYVHLRKQSDLWRGFVPVDAHERKMAAELPDTQRFARCKGHLLCERENRSFSCRTFPFYPYFTKDKTFFGLAYYWEYRGRCWILDRHDLVQPDFVKEFVAAWEVVFEKVEGEREFFQSFSARARGVHTRAGRSLVIIGRDGRAWIKPPGSEELRAPPPGPVGPAP